MVGEDLHHIMGIVLLTLVVDPKASAEHRQADPRCVGDRRPIRAEIHDSAHRRPVNVTVDLPRLADLPSLLEEASVDRRRRFEDVIKEGIRCRHR